MDHYGLVIRHLRKLSGYSLKATAAKIERSVGWLSEIENNQGLSRLKQSEFDRIVFLLNGDKYRKLFKIWVSKKIRGAKVDRSLDGAVIKHLRNKLGLSLNQASQRIGLSKRYLSNLENGYKPVTLDIRNRVMKAYGYASTSFRDLSGEGKRSKAVPLQYKIKILLKHLNEQELQLIYRQASDVLSKRGKE